MAMIRATDVAIKNPENDFSGFLLGNRKKKWVVETYVISSLPAKMPSMT
jgi:hypothetical protein